MNNTTELLHGKLCDRQNAAKECFWRKKMIASGKLNLKMKQAIAKQTVETDVTLATAAMKKPL